MSEAVPSSPLTLSSTAERAFPTLSSTQLDRIAAHGRIRAIEAGEVLVEPGQRSVSFYVVLEGRLDILRPSGSVETLVAVEGPRQFSGEVNMLSGRPAMLRIRGGTHGKLIELDREHPLALIQPDAEPR